jgi:hypothetical protein
MLTELTLDHFKPFGSAQRCPIALITLLYGPNSGGKTSIIQSILLAKQSLNTDRPSKSPIDYNGRLVELGDYQAVAHRHDTSQSIGLSLRFKTRSASGLYVLPPSKAEREAALQLEAESSADKSDRQGVITTISQLTYRLGVPLDNSYNIQLFAGRKDCYLMLLCR